MAVNETYAPACKEPKAYGLIDWMIAAPSQVVDPLEVDPTTLGTLLHLGSSVDTTEFRNAPYYNEIYGDQHGGQQGPPIEMQYLGHVVHFTVELVTWDETALELIRERVVQNPTRGLDSAAIIGAMMFKRNAIRVVANTADQDDVRNFYTCIAREPMSIGYGTKFAAWRIPFTAYRTPCYSLAGGVIEDDNNTSTWPWPIPDP
jgi:hypothetical protein